jgi:hypothetical protein
MGAKLYTAAEFANVRGHLAEKRFAATVAPGSTADVVVLEVSGGQPGDPQHLIRMYAPRKTNAVPAAVVSLPVRLVLHHALPLQPPPDHVNAAIASGSLTAIWGTVTDVQYACSKTPSTGVSLRSLELSYYVRGRGPGVSSDFHCQHMALRLIGHSGFFRAQVRIPVPGGGVYCVHAVS